MPKICDFATCRKFANYGDFYCKPLRCKEHKENYKLVSSLCQSENCKIKSSYNYEGLKNKYCYEHKNDGMVNVSSKKCCEFNCKKQPSYNLKGESDGIYCSLHKKNGMINVKDTKCSFDGCDITPIYNYIGEKKCLFCSLHKIDNMVNVKDKKCEFSGCIKIPSCNFEGEKTPIFCCKHKLDGMIDIISDFCIFENCEKVAIFNFTKEKNGLYCSNHKLDDMIDIKNKRCEYLECKNQPSYNYEGKTNCKFCSIHKLNGMIDIKHKKCKAGFCLGTTANPKYKGYCSSCYQNLFPNDPLTLQIRSKTKEIAVRDFINLNFEGFQHDKPLWTGNCDCTHRRRIDHRKIIGNTLLCIETDENQHKGYNKPDEEIRYDDLFMLHGGKFIYIRFNPDKFKDKNGKSINPMIYTRLPFLKEEIEKQIKRIENEENKDLLEIIKLYYDEIMN
jgi:hypothetical protein